MDNPTPQEQPAAEVSQPVLKKRSRFSAIWILPLAVVIAGGWLVYHSIQRGTTVEITFHGGEGIESGKTQVKYKGVQVGNVTDMTLGKDGQVIVKAQLKPMGIDFARKESRFWLVTPKIGAQGISGLETIVSGAYIGAIPGKGAKATSFVALETAPPFMTDASKPLKIALIAKVLGSIQVGTPVYYREVQVGEVTDFQLAEMANRVVIHVAIEHEYAPLVRTNSRFWNASGIEAKLGITGVKIETESVASILTGGVAFASPNNDKLGNRAPNGERFELHPEHKEEWLKWSPTIKLNLQE